MADKQFEAIIRAVPFSSVVGSSLTLQIDGCGCVAMLMVSVPQPRYNFRQVSEAVVAAIMQQTGGKLSVTLHEDFGRTRDDKRIK